MNESQTIHDILIVDDEPKNLTILRQMLSEEGYVVRPAISGELAIKAVESKPPELILLDIMMSPGMDGFEVCRTLKERESSRDIPIIFVSALDDTQDKVKAFQVGGQDYITKPFQVDEILARVRTHLRLRSMQRAQENQNALLKEEIAKRLQAQVELAEVNAKLQEANAELERLAKIDGLTKVANRRLLDEYLERQWRCLARECKSLGLIMIDIDFFKNYNDTYGHLMGDECLKQIAQCLLRTVKRPADLVSRYGGEEFLVILPDTDIEGTGLLAEEIRQEALSLCIEHRSSDVNEFITLSLGVAAAVPEPTTEPEELIRIADEALYSSKNNGRNRVTVGWHYRRLDRESMTPGT